MQLVKWHAWEGEVEKISQSFINIFKMLIGVSSQVEIHHITATLQLPGPVRITCAFVDVMEYDGQYRFFVMSQSVRAQIEACQAILPDTRRILLIGGHDGPIADDTFIVHNVDELEELMVLSMTPAQKNKIANRIFGVFSFRDQVQLGYEVFQEAMGTTGVTLDEFIGNDQVQLQPDYHYAVAPPPPQQQPQQPRPPVEITRVKRIREKTCVICTTEPSTVLLDCGHKCLCEACAERWVGQVGQCTLCKRNIVKMYIK